MKIPRIMRHDGPDLAIQDNFERHLIRGAGQRRTVSKRDINALGQRRKPAHDRGDILKAKARCLAGFLAAQRRLILQKQRRGTRRLRQAPVNPAQQQVACLLRQQNAATITLASSTSLTSGNL